MKKNNPISVIILAAGEGTRMQSSLAKVLHKVAGKPMVEWVVSAAQALKPSKTVVISGRDADALKSALSSLNVLFASQEKRLGSAHAVLQAKKLLGNFSGNILVLCADTPLVRKETLLQFIKEHNDSGNCASVLSCIRDNPFGYGRIIRDNSGVFKSIIEERDASANQKAVKEINSGIYCFNSPLMWHFLSKIKTNNAKNEYYITDLIDILRTAGKKVGAFNFVGMEELLGINTRVELALAENIFKEKTLTLLMLNGVTIIDTKNTYIEPGAKIGNDTVIHPGCVICGQTVIGKNCSIGPFSQISASTIGDNCNVKLSCVDGAVLKVGVKVGPFSNIRPKTVLKNNVKVGNFSEIKKAVIGEGSKVNHLSYIGDALLGKNVNVGAGTITCNYDGKNKHVTEIADNVFVGSNVNFVAPVSVGKNALIAAGSTVTVDVPSKTLAIARAHQVNKKRKKN